MLHSTNLATQTGAFTTEEEALAQTFAQNRFGRRYRPDRQPLPDPEPCTNFPTKSCYSYWPDRARSAHLLERRSFVP